jgi:hypothetical protein
MLYATMAALAISLAFARYILADKAIKMGKIHMRTGTGHMSKTASTAIGPKARWVIPTPDKPKNVMFQTLLTTAK